MTTDVPDEATNSRRRILQAAAAAGVGAAAFGAPGISVVPAYGLTNSAVTDQCFYFSWRGGAAGGARWGAGAGTRNSNTAVVDRDTATYTWNDATGNGQSLTIVVNGNPIAPSSATITATIAGCTLTLPGGNTSLPPRSGAPVGCSPAGAIRTGTYTATSASGFADDGFVRYLLFDLTCP